MTISDELPATAGECVAMLEELEALKSHLAGGCQMVCVSGRS
ncbi:hypothetical protein QWJ41_20265 [Nocardioides sp. SOB44]|uniref:Uncharacterized protein n=1 Tax=Nocardioides cremeus TaxID=3058044 RepID=A0ABT8TXI2_9ACTN|nr:hypothetical protein [Nocardioides cremeus]MDO3398069.1 hypothetical protein [Nocardioides cremeus]